MSSKKPSECRCRNWSVIVYPESAPQNWRDLVDAWQIEWICSPLHDRDINANGELKKPHWHLLLLYGGVKSAEQVREMTDVLNCPSPMKCHNAKALVRYFAHLDNPEKASYRVSDIESHGGVDVNELLKPTSSERYNLIREMMLFVRDEDLTEFQDLVDYALGQRLDDWFPLLCDNSAIVMTNYIKSCRHRSKPKKDYYTGEIFEYNHPSGKKNDSETKEDKNDEINI